MNFHEKFAVKPGDKIRLGKIDPDERCGVKNKEEAQELIAENTRKLVKLQYELYAENRQSLLIVLQALDAAGKDGVINHVMAPLNPQGCRVQSFKVPTELEKAHDFLWRCHIAAPKNGEIVIFNRSHYEAVLVERVHKLVPKEVWSGRYEQIRQFEKLLQSNRTTIVKFFLHIDRDEQLKRFRARLDDPAKSWKISPSDYKERELWDEYTEAFEDAIGKCTTDDAPWYIIPANTKWFRNLAVSEILVHAMEKMKIRMPSPVVDLEEIRKLAYPDGVPADRLPDNSHSED